MFEDCTLFPTVDTEGNRLMEVRDVRDGNWYRRFLPPYTLWPDRPEGQRMGCRICGVSDRLYVDVDGIEYALCRPCMGVVFDSFAQGSAVLAMLVQRAKKPLGGHDADMKHDLLRHANYLVEQSLEKQDNNGLINHLSVLAHVALDWAESLQSNPKLASARHERNVPPALRLQVIRFHDFTCQYCDRPGTEENDPDGLVWHVDHVRPLSAGGSNDPDNLTLACRTCNLKKGSKGLEEFLREQQR